MDTEKIKISAKKALASMSGLSEAEIEKLWKEEIINQARLKSCLRHEFPAELPKTGRATCSVCKGTLNASHVKWYKLGLKHGGENAQH